ncbi:GntR family transcriptional regulator [Phaeobacter gallaeciensis]|uniref:GntR family transcriptional regulator n=1 Tax=Phaeobacter gallaeciensis TaxID=60890 RepID=A0A366X399_9RHOB|nr:MULTISPECIES: GntR family transcriptional regulator [Roseobacteraceae]MBT8169845.1 GntR family transcriptional regulator [Falsiruegeria litorea]RBW58459.1 GntR family transcriptional regulator [Phaeobacter gallaeciensis]
MNVVLDTEGKETSATHGAYLRLRDLILTGELPAGEKLKIEQLRKLLQTGASPVREALSLLTSDMLVERIDQRGFRAAPVSKENFEEILMLRCTLEETALRASIQNADAAWEDRLVLRHHHMNRASQRKAPDFEDAHKAFHMALLDNSNLPMLARYCSQLYDLNIRYRYLAAGGESYQKRDIVAEHQSILDAALNRDTDSATAHLIEHYQSTGEYLSRQMDG